MSTEAEEQAVSESIKNAEKTEFTQQICQNSFKCDSVNQYKIIISKKDSLEILG